MILAAGIRAASTFKSIRGRKSSPLLKGFFWILRRYGQPSQMFRQCDGDHNGCISIDEFVDKTRQLDLQPRITRADVENMTEVLQFAGDGYEPFVCVKNDCL